MRYWSKSGGCYGITHECYCGIAYNNWEETEINSQNSDRNIGEIIQHAVMAYIFGLD